MNTPSSSPSASAIATEASPLGKPTSYRSDYAPELLFPIPRQAKRDEIGVDGAALPFRGEDLWNAYELSWLNPRGKPVVALGVFRVPADSPNLIESKSLKLYLNSFNQTAFSDVAAVARTIARDLSAAAGKPVRVSVQPLGEHPERRLGYPDGELLDELDIDIDTYEPRPDLLTRADGAQTVTETLVSHLLKSNCLVTGQPDWGTVIVQYTGPRIDRAGLLRYIVSFRNHNEFHEQCVERIYMDIQRHCKPSRLAVQARYTRRGGLDINPFRSSDTDEIPDNVGEIRQ